MNGLTASAIILSGTTAATPLLLAAAGETVLERAGVINIGIEGEMLAGAFAAYAVSGFTGSASAGCLAAAAAGMVLAILFATIAVVRGADQIVTGTAMNLLALGLTGALLRFMTASVPARTPALLPAMIGPLTALDMAALALPPLVFLFLFRTSAGLRLRSAGESMADSAALKIPVTRIRINAAIWGGLLAGLGGASLSLELSNTFIEGASAGRGFIALALVAFGRWDPVRTAAAAIFFGLVQAVQFELQARGVLHIPPQALLLLPYIFSLAALAGFAGKAKAPADLGRA